MLKHYAQKNAENNCSTTSNMDSEKVLDISWGTLIKISVMVLLLYFLYLIRDILIWFVFAIVISVLFNPVINFLHKKRVPRVLAASFIYVVVFGGLILFLYSIASVFLVEVQRFSENFPKYFEQISPVLRGAGVQAFTNTEAFLKAIQVLIQQMSANIFGTLSVVFGGLFTALFVISSAFFLSLEEESVGKMLGMFFPQKYEAVISSIWNRSQKKVTNWFLTRI